MNEVYLITNKINGKRYIGITCRGYKVRWHEHILNAKSGLKTILGNAIRKYGEENFSVELIEDNISDADIQKREIYYIDKFDSFYMSGMGYNMTRGGGGVAGYKHSETTKAQISNSLKGHVFPETRNHKISKKLKGLEKSESWKKAISKARIGKYTKENNPFYKKHHSEETKTKIRIANSKRRVLQIDPATLEVIQIFYNLNDAGRWVVSQGLSQADYTTCACRIGEVCNKYNDYNHKAYSFIWIFEEGQSTN